MTAPLTFRPAVACAPGTVYSLLAECYAEILDKTLQDKLRQFDHEVFAAPDTVGACAFISFVSDVAVGFLSYDPRQGPAVGIVGHNGVLPVFQRRGYGTQQILEILRRLTACRFICARVSTSEHPFFAPARRMYEKCGFRPSRRIPGGNQNPHDIVQYEKLLTT